MKIAVFSDIHGNDVAYKAAIDDAKKRGADSFIVAGDMVSDFPFGSEIISRTRELTSLVVKGNREEYLCRYLSSNSLHWKNYKQYSGMIWSFENMTKDDYGYVENLPGELEISVCGGLKLYVTHIANEPLACFDKTEANILICGHTHRPEEIRKNGKVFINPGSVGINYSKGFNAEYMIVSYDGYDIKTEIIHVPYDCGELFAFISSIENQAAQHWYKMLLATQSTGINYITELFETSDRLKSERGISTNDVPNDIWDEIIDSFKEKNIIT